MYAVYMPLLQIQYIPDSCKHAVRFNMHHVFVHYTIFQEKHKLVELELAYTCMN